MTNLRDAVAFLKDAVGQNKAQPVYVFHGGACHARAPSVAASYPTPEILGTFALAAEALEPALARRAAEEPALEFAGDRLTLRWSRPALRAAMRIAEAEEPFVDLSAVGWAACPPSLVPALRAALPFVADDGTWQRGVRLRGDRVSAFGGRSMVEVEAEGCALADVNLDGDAARYLVGLRDGPQEFGTAPGALWFRWPVGAWVRLSLLATPWPEQTDRLLADLGDPPVALDDAWRGAIADVAALGDGAVVLTPDGVRGRTDAVDSAVEFATGVAATTEWAKDVLLPVLRVAERWDPDAAAAGGRSAFAGKGLRGVVAGIRR
jgi:hypothetical protein